MTYIVKALGTAWDFGTLRLAKDFARQLRDRGHEVEVWARNGSAGGRLRV